MYLEGLSFELLKTHFSIVSLMRVGLFPVRQISNAGLLWSLALVIVTEVSCHAWACSVFSPVYLLVSIMCFDLHSRWFLYSAVEWFCCLTSWFHLEIVNLSESVSKTEICLCLVAAGMYSRVCLWIAEVVHFCIPSHSPLVLDWQSMSCLSWWVRAVLKVFLLSSLHTSLSLRNEAGRRFLRQRTTYL